MSSTPSAPSSDREPGSATTTFTPFRAIFGLLTPSRGASNSTTKDSGSSEATKTIPASTNASAAVADNSQKSLTTTTPSSVRWNDQKQQQLINRVDFSRISPPAQFVGGSAVATTPNASVASVSDPSQSDQAFAIANASDTDGGVDIAGSKAAMITRNDASAVQSPWKSSAGNSVGNVAVSKRQPGRMRKYRPNAKNLVVNKKSSSSVARRIKHKYATQFKEPFDPCKVDKAISDMLTNEPLFKSAETLERRIAATAKPGLVLYPTRRPSRLPQKVNLSIAQDTSAPSGASKKSVSFASPQNASLLAISAESTTVTATPGARFGTPFPGRNRNDQEDGEGSTSIVDTWEVQLLTEQPQFSREGAFRFVDIHEGPSSTPGALTNRVFGVADFSHSSNDDSFAWSKNHSLSTFEHDENAAVTRNSKQRPKKRQKTAVEIIETWKCDSCGFDKNPSDESACRECGKRRGGGKKQSGWGSCFAPMYENKWQCAVCSVYNENSVQKCVSCDTPRTGAGENKSEKNPTASEATTETDGSGISNAGFTFGGAPSSSQKSTTKFGFGSSSENDPGPAKFTFGSVTPAQPTTDQSSDKPAAPFTFPTKAAKNDTTAQTGTFKFGSTQMSTGETTKPAGAFKFGSTQAPSNSNATSTSSFPASASKFSFGNEDTTTPCSTNAGGNKTENDTKGTSAPNFSFGAKPNEQTSKFSFGVSAPTIPVNGDKKPFVFGASSKAGEKAGDKKAFSFAAPSASEEAKRDEGPAKRGRSDDAGDAAPRISFGSSKKRPSTEATKTTFGAPVASESTSGKIADPKPAFSFGAATPVPATTPAATSKPTFTFGAPAAGSSTTISSAITSTASSAPPKTSMASDNTNEEGPRKRQFLFGGTKTSSSEAKSSKDVPNQQQEPANGTTFGSKSFAPPSAAGTPAPAAPAFTFGSSKPSNPLSSPPAPAASFGSTPAAPVPATTFAAPPAPAAPTPGATFGITPGPSATSTAVPSGPSFGANTMSTASTPGIAFGSQPGASSTTTSAPISFGSTPAPAKTPATGASTFGTTPATATAATPAPNAFGGPVAGGGFGAPTPAPVETGAQPFGGSAPSNGSAGFQFGATTNASSTNTKNAISFGSGAATTFGAPAPVPGGTFQFGASGTSAGGGFGAGQNPPAPSQPGAFFGNSSSAQPFPPAASAPAAAPTFGVMPQQTPGAPSFGGGGFGGAANAATNSTPAATMTPGGMAAASGGPQFNIGTRTPGKRRIVRAKRPVPRQT